ncbi:MAG: energy transducer TonB [Deltaproteobacteria bacterium]|nr:energy transducer TonB [Deltaproteobacteria bacterium]MBW1930892.1 energy transducer TonB [Deltaproteobacteria bacterium]
MGRLIVAACVAVGTHAILLMAGPGFLPRPVPPNVLSHPITMTLNVVSPPMPISSPKQATQEVEKEIKIPVSKPKIPKAHRPKVTKKKTVKKRPIPLAKRKAPKPIVKKKREEPTSHRSHEALIQKKSPLPPEPQEPKEQSSDSLEQVDEPSHPDTPVSENANVSQGDFDISNDVLFDADQRVVASLSPSTAPTESIVEARPEYLKNPPPFYPMIAKRRGYEGTVILEILVTKEGKVGDLRVFQSSGYRVLDKAAMRSVKGWSFEPGRRGDKRVDMWVKVPIRFVLR